MFRAKSSCRCWHFHYWMSPYRRFDEKQEQTCRCLVLSSTRWLRLGVLRMLDGTRPGSSEKSMQMMFAGSAKRQLFAFAGLPPGICWLKAHAVMLAFFALHFGQFAHLQCQCRRRQGVSNFARSLQTRRPTLNQARTEHRWRHRALALWLVHEAKDEETQIVCSAWLGRHFESFWNLESRITMNYCLFQPLLQNRFGICYRHLTCQSIPQAWDAATKARQNWTYPGKCRFICMVILDAFVWSFAWFESFASIFPTYIMSVELSTYVSLLYACIICIFSYLSDLSYDLFGREALPGGGSVISRRELFVKDLAQNLMQILAESIRSLNDLRRPEACLMRRPGCKLQCL